MGLYWLMKSKKTHPAQWVGLEDGCGWGLEDFCLFILKAHGLRSMGLGVLNTVSKEILKTHLHPTHPGVLPLMNEPANAVSLCA